MDAPELQLHHRNERDGVATNATNCLWDVEEIATGIVDAAFEIHRQLGPGLLESAYEVLLAELLERRGLKVERQKPLALEFRGIRVPDAFRVDLLVAGEIVVEVKAIDRLAPIHRSQLLTYLRLLDLHLGLLINFGEYHVKNGLRRVVRDYRPSRS